MSCSWEEPTTTQLQGRGGRDEDPSADKLRPFPKKRALEKRTALEPNTSTAQSARTKRAVPYYIVAYSRIGLICTPEPTFTPRPRLPRSNVSNLPRNLRIQSDQTADHRKHGKRAPRQAPPFQSLWLPLPPMPQPPLLHSPRQNRWRRQLRRRRRRLFSPLRLRPWLPLMLRDPPM